MPELKTAVAFIVYKRPETTRRVFEAIRQAGPSKLYLIADGPKTSDLATACAETSRIVEDGIDWECQLHKIMADENLGCARRVQSGLDEVFRHERKAIVLEDDTLPDLSFFKFCDELLEKYENDERVAHISGCSLHPKAFQSDASYCFSSIINIWGWATWRRSWKHYDLSMESWDHEDKKRFISHWCSSSNYGKSIRKMFDLHCNNEDPWTWDYQWVYTCWKRNGLSITPAQNLVSNLGIGPDASNTFSNASVPLFPEKLESLPLPMEHPSVKRDFSFEKRYIRKSKPPIVRRFKNWLKARI